MQVPVFLMIGFFVRSSMQTISLNTEEWKCGVEDGHHKENIEDINNSSTNETRRSAFAELHDFRKDSTHHAIEKQYRYKRAGQEKGLAQNDIDVGLQDSLWTSSTTRFVELVIVADNRMYLSYNSNEDNIIKKVQSVVAIVNTMFKDLGIVVVLQGIEIWKDEDKVEVSELYNMTLRNFKPYREELMKRIHHDNLALFTGVNFVGNTVGFAPIGTLCNIRSSVNLNMANSRRGSTAIANTLAHEMGHNFGMGHDWEGKEDGVACVCPTKRCIMGGKGDEEDSTPGFEGWSDCSKKSLAKWFSKASRNCLKTVPTKIMASPHCGNGVVEIGEECDCGHAAECNTKCCNTTSCTLIANATCGAGACCDLQTCKPREGGWECREAQDACDLSEYCRGGDNIRCPNDVRKMEGQPCPQGHCYQNNCGSYNRDEMCKALWGPTSNTGKDPCNRFNENTCDAPWCSTAFGSKPAAGGGSWNEKQTGNWVCKRFRSRGPNDWRPSNGAPCGDHQYCEAQSCTSIPSPSEGQCPSNCSGHGTCNSLGNCHCDLGHAHPNCAYPGLGGSVDSGPIADPEEMEEFKKGVYFAFLLAVPLLAIFWCLWWNTPLLWTAKRRAAVQHHCPCLMTPLQGCCCPIILSANTWCYDSIPCCRFCYPQKKPKDVADSQGAEISNGRSSQYRVEKQNGHNADMSRSNVLYNQTEAEPKSNVVNQQPKVIRQLNRPNPLILRVPPDVIDSGSNSGNGSIPSGSFRPARLSSRSAQPFQRDQSPATLPGVGMGEHRPSRPPRPIVRGPPIMPPNHSKLNQTFTTNNIGIHKPTEPSQFKKQSSNDRTSEDVAGAHIPTRRAPGPPPTKGRGKRIPTGAVSMLTGAKWDVPTNTRY